MDPAIGFLAVAILVGLAGWSVCCMATQSRHIDQARPRDPDK